jgi:putative colanic acid biosynthesis UDP-glucose lipid carrier transferase
MLEHTNGKIVFQRAPQPVQALVAAVMEPSIAALLLLAVLALNGQDHVRGGFILSLMTFGLSYPGRNRFKDAPVRAALDITTSWLAVLGVLALIGYATSSLDLFPQPVLLSWALATPVLQWGALALGQQWLARQATQPGEHRSVVVIGSGTLGAKVALSLKARTDTNSEFIGFFDDRSGDRVDPSTGARQLGSLRQAAAYIRDHGVGEVHITLPLGSHPRMLDLLEQLQGTTASIFFVPDVTGVGVIQGRLQDMDGIPVVGLCETPFTGINQLVKRISDIVLASVILALISPVLLAVAIGVKRSGPGPIIFRQRRNGLDGKEIVVYKFRSMCTLDDGAVVRQASKGDPRLTPFGAFIRKTSLDELPQFINVLQGHMSVVGPRPHAVAHNEQYRQIIKAYMVRHKVKPGITGWAQVNGQRGETDTTQKMQARVEYDLEYLRHWSLGLDLRIILLTIRLVFFDRHAY